MIAEKILITGATGFIGSRLVGMAAERGYAVCPVSRHKSVANGVVIGDIGPRTDWTRVLEGVSVVVHLAARVHQITNKATDALDAYHETNTLGTEQLALQAAASGVRRLVFMSTIKVNGEYTQRGCAFLENDRPNPVNAYALSKCAAEESLKRIAGKSNLEIVTIRPPLVYGPGVRANFRAMLCWLKKGIPLPFGAIHNSRSLVALDNLVDFILTCIDHPKAANQTFLVSDDQDLSTTSLLKKSANAMNISTRLIPVPVSMLQLSAVLLGKREIAQRLCESLKVDISKAREVLSWRPSVTLEKGIQQTVDWYLGRDGR